MKRSFELEKMDLDDFSFESYRACLHDIEKINRWTNAYSSFLSIVEKFLKIKTKLNQKNNTEEPLRVLDVGCGGGELLKWLSVKYRNKQWAEKYTEIHWLGIDKHPWAKKVSEESLVPSEKGMKLEFHSGDIFDYSRNDSVDLIICSLFTHHLSEKELVKYLKWLDQTAELGWFISDVHRHFLPYLAMKVLPKIMGLNKMVQYDAPLSVQRSFVKEEWYKYLEQAQLKESDVAVKWEIPFKYNIIGIKRNV